MYVIVSTLLEIFLIDKAKTTTHHVCDAKKPLIELQRKIIKVGAQGR